jgi:hypothetical protein
MNLSDVKIIAKKIAVGIVIYLVPTGIVSGGLWATQAFLTAKKEAGKSSLVKPQAQDTRSVISK